jgi:hypothetical protein
VNVRRVNFALWSAAVLMTAVALGAVLLAMMLPVEVEAPRVRAERAATTRSSDDAVLALATFEPVWNLALRRSFDAAQATTPVKEAGPAEVKSEGAITLLGTIGDTLALIQVAGGVVEVKGVGESAGGGKILAVRPAEVDVEVGGKVVTVRKVKETEGG